MTTRTRFYKDDNELNRMAVNMDDYMAKMSLRYFATQKLGAGIDILRSFIEISRLVIDSKVNYSQIPSQLPVTLSSIAKSKHDNKTDVDNQNVGIDPEPEYCHDSDNDNTNPPASDIINETEHRHSVYLSIEDDIQEIFLSNMYGEIFTIDTSDHDSDTDSDIITIQTSDDSDNDSGYHTLRDRWL